MIMNKTMEIKITRTYEIPKEEKCSGCRQMDADVYCALFKRVIRLDNRFKDRVPVEECMKARKAAGRKKARRK